MNVFNVRYWKKGKENGVRKYRLHSLCSDTYESVLFEFTLDHLCESSYYWDYEWYMLNEHVFVKRIRANSLICEYEVTLLHWKDRSKIVATYIVEMECLESENSDNILKQEKELKPLKLAKPLKEKLPTVWLKNESGAIRRFLYLLKHEGSLKALKGATYMTKPTFYRNLKVCQEKGYIVDGKLVKRLLVTK
ncbi:hypothetical protein [Fluviicola sp.]|uniref:hypothetical protein n=1 Tax=Fluviicola sp. TaxID=1917219 RepID=UPI0031E22737